MNKNTLFLVLLGTVVLGGLAFAYMQSNKTPTSVSPTLLPSNDKTATEKETSDLNTNSTSYQIYSQALFDDNAAKRRVLFFFAPWCPTCRPADAQFSQNAGKIPEDVVLFRVSYDDEQALKQKYGVTYQHTFIQVDENGEVVARWNGGGLEELLSNIK